MISEAEIGFLERRGRFIRMWRYAGARALAVLVGFTCYLFVANPLLINPFHVMKQIEADAIPNSTMVLMAAMMPIVFLNPRLNTGIYSASIQVVHLKNSLYPTIVLISTSS